MTEFERGILDWIAENSEDKALQAQCRAASVTTRDNTGVGCYIGLEMQSAVPKYRSVGPLNGPDFLAENLQNEGSSLVWFEKGVMKTIEVFTYNDAFPKNHDDLGAVRYGEAKL